MIVLTNMKGQWFETSMGHRACVYDIIPDSYLSAKRAVGAVLVSPGNISLCSWNLDGSIRANKTLGHIARHLPACTGWDWVEPKPVDPGAGWRLIDRVKDKPELDDEYLGSDGVWRIRMYPGSAYDLTTSYRRRVNPPAVITIEFSDPVDKESFLAFLVGQRGKWTVRQ